MHRLLTLTLLISTGGAVLPPASAVAEPRVAPSGVDWLDRSDDLLTGSSLARDLRVAASLAGMAVEDPSYEHVATPAAVPLGLQEPVGKLLGAIDAASELSRGAVRTDPSRLLELRRRAESLLADSQLAERAGRVLERASRLQARIDAAIDSGAMHQAGVVVATAIDSALPALRRYAAALPTSRSASAGCDVVDLVPALCIGGNPANTYTQDVALQIDLGGGDTYRNSAGGADPVPTLGNGIPVSVSIDVSGNDDYEASFPMASKARAVQGAGVLGGVGFLVDGGGSDTYAATGPAANAQGFALAGVGVLADNEGLDSYSVSDPSPGFSSAMGQGATSLGALGLLVDRGTENDSYLIESTSSPRVETNGIISPGSVAAIGQGAGYLGGVGIMVDQGGEAVVTARGTVEPMSEDETRPNSLSVGRSYAHGSGALSGLGLALAGPGGTDWASTLDLGPAPGDELQGSSGVFSQGSGNLGAEGVLLDVGGKDSYLTLITARAKRTLTSHDGDKTPLVEAYTPDLYNESQGLGYLGGTGALRDLQGDDTYIAVAKTRATATIRDERTGPPGQGEGPAQAVATTLYTRNYAQGVSNAGQGVLFDQAGNDSYVVETTTEARTIATSADPQRTASGAPSPAKVDTWAQGAAQGAAVGKLIDLDGADVYSSKTESLGVVLPQGTGSSGEVEASAQGSSVGVSPFIAPVAFLVDLGSGEDTFAALPADVPCEGVRGQDRWKDCGPGYSGGYNQ